MKSEQEESQKTIIRSASQVESNDFDIDEDMKVHVFEMLRNGIYSNPIRAVVREYLCNAIDACVEVGGSSKDVIIVLPSRLDTTFKIIDNGVGLSDQDVKSVYRFYGNSTKRDSNDGIGQLGVGSKSAFSYVDTFNIVARKDGEENIYTASVNKNSGEKGSIYRLSSRKVDLPNGVEIHVPVKAADITSFEQAVAFYLSFFKEEERPQVEGNLAIKYQLDNLDSKDESLRIYYKARSYYDNQGCYMVMGNIPYVLKEEDLTDFEVPSKDKDGNVKKDGNGRIVYDSIKFSALEKKFIAEFNSCMYFNIGDFDVAVSRETPRFTAKTKLALKNKLIALFENACKKYSEAIREPKTLWEAKYLYHIFYNSIDIQYRHRNTSDANLSKFTESFPQLVSLIKNLGGFYIKPIIFKNKEITNNTIVLSEEILEKYSLQVVSLTDSGRVKKSRPNSSYGRRAKYSIIVKKETPDIVVNDSKTISGVNQRCKTAIKSDPDSARIVLWDVKSEYTKNKDKDFSELYKELQLKEKDVKKLMSFERFKNNSKKESKHLKDIFKLKDSSFSHHYSLDSADWEGIEESETKSGTKYYVPINRFVPQVLNNNVYSPVKELPRILKLAKDLFGISIDTVYGVKIRKLEDIKNDSSYINIFDYIKASIEKSSNHSLKQMDISAERLSRKLATGLEYKVFEFFKNNIQAFHEDVDSLSKEAQSFIVLMKKIFEKTDKNEKIKIKLKYYSQLDNLIGSNVFKIEEKAEEDKTFDKEYATVLVFLQKYPLTVTSIKGFSIYSMKKEDLINGLKEYFQK